MSVIKLPPSKKWLAARNSRLALYNHPLWYDQRWWVRDKIQKIWEHYTHIMRKEEETVNRKARQRYMMPR